MKTRDARQGHTLHDPIEIDIGRGLIALIDADDYDFARLYRWRPTSRNTHVQTNIGKHVYSLHRLIMRARPGEEVDHINRDGLDNRKVNLRLCTRAQNNFNRWGEKNKTGFRGVLCQRGRYFAMLRAGGKTYIGGRRSAAVEAARDYDDLARAHHGTFASLNFKGGSQRTDGAACPLAPTLLGAQQ